jgi:hypothetical protein
VAAARAAVRDFTRFDQTALRHGSQMIAAARAMVAQVKADCGGAIPASIANGTRKQQDVYLDLVVEGAFDLTLRVIQPLAHPATALAKGLEHVRFSKRSFTRAVHGTAKSQLILLAIKPSDLCADVKAAVASQFAADPAGTTAFANRIDRTNPGPMVSVDGIIKKTKSDLVTTRDQAAVKRLKKLDARYVKFSGHLGLTWGGKLGKVLVSPPPAGGTGGGFPTTPPPPPSSPASSRSNAAMTAAFATL